MIRVLVVLAAFAPAIAHAEGPCDAAAAAAQKAGDPSLASPKEPKAVAAMRRGAAHYSLAIKQGRVVATRDQAAAEFRAAIDAYVEAAMHSSAPSILFNLAQAYRQAADYPSAIDQYRVFLDRGKPQPPLRALVDCHIALMSAELERAAASAPPSGPTQDCAGAPTTLGAQPAPAPMLAVPPAEVTPRPLPSAPEPPRPWHADGVGWAITGAGAVGVGVGVFLLLDGRDLRAQSQTETRDDVRRALDEKADGRQRWGTVAAIAGATVVGLGVLKLAIVPRPREQTIALRVGRGLWVEGRF